jgi:predicted MFS family arabinose efflux permease
MWGLDSAWFDVAVVTSVLAVGTILFGRFEEHKSRGRRALKVVIIVAAVALLRTTTSRLWIYVPIAFFGVLAAWIHLWWLPSHGINGWTAEPRDKYLALVDKRRRV